MNDEHTPEFPDEFGGKGDIITRAANIIGNSHHKSRDELDVQLDLLMFECGIYDDDAKIGYIDMAYRELGHRTEDERHQRQENSPWYKMVRSLGRLAFWRKQTV